MTRMMGMPDITPQSFANQLESIVPDAKTIIQQLQDKAHELLFLMRLYF